MQADVVAAADAVVVVWASPGGSALVPLPLALHAARSATPATTAPTISGRNRGRRIGLDCDWAGGTDMWTFSRVQHDDRRP
jgi:hypothetical protein